MSIQTTTKSPYWLYALINNYNEFLKKVNRALRESSKQL